MHGSTEGLCLDRHLVEVKGGPASRRRACKALPCAVRDTAPRQLSRSRRAPAERLCSPQYAAGSERCVEASIARDATVRHPRRRHLQGTIEGMHRSTEGLCRDGHLVEIKGGPASQRRVCKAPPCAVRDAVQRNVRPQRHVLLPCKCRVARLCTRHAAPRANTRLSRALLLPRRLLCRGMRR